MKNWKNQHRCKLRARRGRHEVQGIPWYRSWKESCGADALLLAIGLSDSGAVIRKGTIYDRGGNRKNIKFNLLYYISFTKTKDMGDCSWHED